MQTSQCLDSQADRASVVCWGACRPHIRQLLLAHGVIVESGIDDALEDAHTAHPGCRAFDHMEAGLQYCEERFLAVGVSGCLGTVACALCDCTSLTSQNRCSAFGSVRTVLHGLVTVCEMWQARKGS